jgi:23S rRNA (adenine2503-C2)-methyltransferase
MSDLSKNLRDQLDLNSEIQMPNLISENTSKDGTIKWLFESGVGQAIEAVYIPESDRGTLCISSQVGCALDCSFCATGHQGFNRNLDVSEIVGQLCFANSRLPRRKTGLPAVSNVVFMGMGEPLANYKNVIKAIEIMLSDYAYGLSRRRVTLSTSGIVPNIDLLSDACNVSLAVSLHAPNDKLRDSLVPINKIHPISDLLDACWRYAEKYSNRYITFEYVMLANINDSMEHAQELSRLISNKPAKINLIPFNPFSGTKYKSSPIRQIKKFQMKLREKGIIVTTRKTRGDDIAAACGQLAGKVNNRVITRLGEKRGKAVTLQ